MLDGWRRVFIEISMFDEILNLELAETSVWYALWNAVGARTDSSSHDYCNLSNRMSELRIMPRSLCQGFGSCFTRMMD